MTNEGPQTNRTRVLRHGSSESQVVLKRNDNCGSIADGELISKMFFIKIGRWPFEKLRFKSDT